MQCGNVWLGPDTQIKAEVLGPEGKERGEGPKGKKVLSLRALKSKKHPRPKLHCPRGEMLLSLNLVGRMSNMHEGEEGSRRMAKPHRAGPRSSRGGRRFINTTAFHRLRGCGLQRTFTTTRNHKSLLLQQNLIRNELG